MATKSSESMDRVQQWLVEKVPSSQADEQEIEKAIKSKNMNKKPAPKAVEVEKTTVAYHLPGEELPYISTFPGKGLTLSQFKQLITKKGSYRYVFYVKLIDTSDNFVN